MTAATACGRSFLSTSIRNWSACASDDKSPARLARGAEGSIIGIPVGLVADVDVLIAVPDHASVVARVVWITVTQSAGGDNASPDRPAPTAPVTPAGPARYAPTRTARYRPGGTPAGPAHYS